MKRLLLAMLLVALPSVAFAFDTTQAVRVGVLRGTDALQDDVADALRHELRARGIDAFDAVRTYDEAVRDGAPVADYYVEIIAAEATTTERGGIGVGTRHAGVDLGVLVSKVAAELRIYDADMQLVSTHDLHERDRRIAPTAVSVGGGSFFAYVALPFLERAQIRKMVRATGRNAAGHVLEAVR